MHVFLTKASIRHELQWQRSQGAKIALVPTMGYLHQGHLALMRLAKAKADHVVASIFVNPTQFAPHEDLTSYPKDTERDLALLRGAGVHALFMPDAMEMYGAQSGTGSGTIVDVPDLSRILQGAVRPTHFRGVATVVTKLFNIVRPDVAVFGEKDYQQLTLIRRMVHDLDMAIDILGHPTVRESDGLAMSSRNVRLTPHNRQRARIINQALDQAEVYAKGQEFLDPFAICALLRQVLALEPAGTIESLDLCDAQTLAVLAEPTQLAGVILVAVRFGDVLLIDQRVINSGR